jgi:signal transduction histidine kinase
VRLNARGRLALPYTALVFAAGVTLVALTYVLVRHGLASRPRLFVWYGSDDRPPMDPAVAMERLDRIRAETLSQLLTQSAIALAVVTVLAAVLGWLVAGRVLRPIRAVSATAQRLSAENIGERVPVTTPDDELAALARTINGMLDRLQAGIADRDRALHSQRMFVANAAHELRTPLTTMRTAIDVTLDGDPGTDELIGMSIDVRDAVVHSQHTLDGLLALARSHAGTRRPGTADLADVVTRILDTAGKDAAAHDVALHADLRPAPVAGDAVLLDRMVRNLVDNAIRHNEFGGRASVSTGVEGPHAWLQVTNTGARLEPSTVDELFEPFVRGSHSDGGAGLGLSIVRAVVEAHHGTLNAETPARGGLDVTVRLQAPPQRSNAAATNGCR